MCEQLGQVPTHQRDCVACRSRPPPGSQFRTLEHDGESVPISLLGDHPGLEPAADESIAFPVEETTCTDTASCPIVSVCDDFCGAAGCRNADGQLFAETITVSVCDAASSCE